MASPLNSTDPSGFYGGRIHHDLTVELAGIAGLKPNVAEYIGRFNNMVDTDHPPIELGKQYYKLSLYRLLGDRRWMRDRQSAIKKEQREWHFPIVPGKDEVTWAERGNSAATQKADAAIKTCNLMAFAYGLHVIQDSYSHEEEPSLAGRWFGHAGDFLNTKCDDPYSEPRRTEAMAKYTYKYLLEFLNACPCVKKEMGMHIGLWFPRGALMKQGAAWPPPQWPSPPPRNIEAYWRDCEAEARAHELRERDRIRQEVEDLETARLERYRDYLVDTYNEPLFINDRVIQDPRDASQAARDALFEKRHGGP